MSTATTNSGIKRAVYEGRLSHTQGNLSASHLKQNKTGKIVSISASKSAKKNYKKQGMSGPQGWASACKKAEQQLGYWPVPVRKGTEFYKLAKHYYSELS